MRRRIRRALMALARGCDVLGRAGYMFFWRMQKKLQTPEHFAEDMKFIADTPSLPLDDEFWAEMRGATND